VFGISVVPASTIFLLDFRISSDVWYFLVFIVSLYLLGLLLFL